MLILYIDIIMGHLTQMFNIALNTATCLPSRKLYRLDSPDSPDTAGEARTSSEVMYSYGPPHMTKQNQDDQPELTYSSYVRTRDVT